jgi:ankyrin repeat protein
MPLSTTAFLSLPNEIIIEIVEHLDKEQDINYLIRVSRRLYHLFDDYLYRYNIKHRRCSALFWAAKHGRGSTARKLLHLGADVNATVEKPRSYGNGPKADSTPLHLAAWEGHLPMVKLLLEFGADPEARVREGMTPLLFALLARHEKVARTISRRISNLQNCLVDSTKRLTPLHVSCGLGLWSCAGYFLNEGADVDATDASAMTPLHHALL